LTFATFIEQILGPDELPAATILERLEQDALRQAAFAHAGFPDKHDILRLGDEVEFGQRADLPAIHTGLFGVRKGLESPESRETGALDPCLEGFFPAGDAIRRAAVELESRYTIGDPSRRRGVARHTLPTSASCAGSSVAVPVLPSWRFPSVVVVVESEIVAGNAAQDHALEREVEGGVGDEEGGGGGE
jgi:hypothetical protein